MLNYRNVYISLARSMSKTVKFQLKPLVKFTHHWKSQKKHTGHYTGLWGYGIEKLWGHSVEGLWA